MLAEATFTGTETARYKSADSIGSEQFVVELATLLIAHLVYANGGFAFRRRDKR